jgi:hypothetical protein
LSASWHGDFRKKGQKRQGFCGSQRVVRAAHRANMPTNFYVQTVSANYQNIIGIIGTAAYLFIRPAASWANRETPDMERSPVWLL